MRFEEQVAVLCAQALAAKEEPDIRTILSELRNLLHSHIESLRAGFFSVYAPPGFEPVAQPVDTETVTETSETPDPVRGWRQIVQEIASEQDHEKAVRLSHELNRLLKGHRASQDRAKRSA